VSQPSKTAKQPLIAKDVEWRRYPQLEKLFEPDQFEPGLRRLEKSLRHLEELVKSGTESDRERARTAALAYVRTFSLIRLIVDKRHEMATNSATSSPSVR
jgi:hypothetical protein